MSTQYPIPRQTRQAILTASADQTAFAPLDFILFASDDLQIRTKAPAANDWVLVDSAAYTATPAPPFTDWPAVPVVTFAAGLAAGTQVWLKGARLHSRLTNVTQGGAVRSVAIETELDRQSAVLQELRRDIDAQIAANGEGELIASGIANDGTAPGSTVALALEGLDERTTEASADIVALQAQLAASNITLSGGVLSLVQGVARPDSDVAAATAVSLVPDGLNTAEVLDENDQWVAYEFDEIALGLTTEAHLANSNYDIYRFVTGGQLSIGTGPSWASAVSRGSGAGTTEYEIFQGRYVNKHQITLINGANAHIVPPRRAVLSGGFRTTLAGQTCDTVTKRFLSNLNNIRPRPMLKLDATTTWIYSILQFRQANGNAANQLDVFHCVAGRACAVDVNGNVSFSATGQASNVGIGIDSATVDVSTGNAGAYAAVVPVFVNTSAWYRGALGLGYHSIKWLERAYGSGTQTWGGNTVWTASGIRAEIMN